MPSGVHGRRSRLGWAAVLVAAALLGSCTSGVDVDEEGPPGADLQPAVPPPADAEGRVRGGTLRVGLLVDPVSIDPRFVVDDEGELLVDALFEPLVRIDAGGEVEPAAARRWDIEDDGRRFTFHLREASFHDGTPVTAADFVRTLDHIADVTAQPPSYLAYLLADVVGIERSQSEGGGIAGVTAEDDTTLTIELRGPQPGFLRTLADPSLVPTPPAATDDPAAYAQQPIGNGPFAMAGPREPGAFLRLVRADGYHDPALLDEVLFTLYDAAADDDTQWNDLLEGQLHLAQLAPTRREEAIERFGWSRDGYTGPGVLRGVRSPVYLYGFDTTRAPFDDPRLRRAISLSIDRAALAQEVAEGTRLPATSLVPPSIPGAQPGRCSACVHDPDAARELLDEVVVELLAGDTEDPDQAGVADDEPDAAVDEPAADPDGEGDADAAADDPAADQDGEEDPDADVAPPPTAAEVIGGITLYYNRGILHGAIAERMAADIGAALDLEAEFQAQDLAPFIRGVRRGELPVFRHGWDVTEPSVGAYLYPMFHSSEVGRDNLTRFEDEQVDALLDQARASADPGERRRVLQEAERRVLDVLPAIPVLWYRHDAVIRPEVRDLTYTAMGRLSLADAWFDPDIDPDTASDVDDE